MWLGVAVVSVVAALVVISRRKNVTSLPQKQKRSKASCSELAGVCDDAHAPHEKGLAEAAAGSGQPLTPECASRKDSLLSASTSATPPLSCSQGECCRVQRDASVDSGSPTAALDVELQDADGAAPALLECPWHNGLAHFLTHGDIARLCASCRAVKHELTVGPSSLLLVPSLELKKDMLEVEAALQKVSLGHVRILRVWGRAALLTISRHLSDGRSEGLNSLEKLAVRGCPMQRDEVRGLLAPCLSMSRTFDLLNLEKNSLRDDAVRTICSSGVLEMIQSLSLRFNMIGPGGAEALARCSTTRTLRFLNLKMNCVGDEGAAALARMLGEVDCALVLLNLRRQNPPLTDKSAVAFAAELKSNTSLRKLRLRKNRITDAGASALASALGERMQRLCSQAAPADEVFFELDLEDNKITDSGAAALLQACEAIPARAKIEVLLFGNPITEGFRDHGCTPSRVAKRLVFASKLDGAR